jgi:lipopolysaccharide export system permease protein
VQGASGPLFVLQRGSRQELDARAARERSVSILRFDRYTLDLASAASQPDDRARKPKELYLHELLDPPDGFNEASRRELIAEGHKRLTWPLNALVFALIGLACLLPRDYSRHGPWRNILIAVIGAALVQAAGVAAGSLASRSLALIPLMYAAPLVPAIVCLAMLRGDRPRRRGQMLEPGLA